MYTQVQICTWENKVIRQPEQGALREFLPQREGSEQLSISHSGKQIGGNSTDNDNGNRTTNGNIEC